jgi:hypothetical protein
MPILIYIGTRFLLPIFENIQNIQNIQNIEAQIIGTTRG